MEGLCRKSRCRGAWQKIGRWRKSHDEGTVPRYNYQLRCASCVPTRKRGRVVEGTGLENRRRATVREFESHRFRQILLLLFWRSDYNCRLRADSSAGRAPRSQCGGREFDPHSVHHIPVRRRPAKARTPREIKGSGLFHVRSSPGISVYSRDFWGHIWGHIPSSCHIHAENAPNAPE